MKYLFLIPLLLSASLSLGQLPDFNLDEIENGGNAYSGDWSVSQLISNEDSVFDPQKNMLIPLKGASFTSVVFTPTLDDKSEGVLIFTLKNAPKGVHAIQCQVSNYSGPWEIQVQKFRKNRVKFITVDFSSVGNAMSGHFGEAMSWYNNTVLVSEKVNKKLVKSKTGSFQIPAGEGIEKAKSVRPHHNAYFVVQIDPVNATAINKFYTLGHLAPTGINVINEEYFMFASGMKPSVLFTFGPMVQEGDVSTGNLLAFKQNPENINAPGSWINLGVLADSTTATKDINKLIKAHQIALENGATVFNNLTDMVYLENQEVLLAAEAGSEDMSYLSDSTVLLNGTPALHLQERLAQGSGDPYGRLLKINPYSLQVHVYKEGSEDFANPSHLEIFAEDGYTENIFMTASKHGEPALMMSSAQGGQFLNLEEGMQASLTTIKSEHLKLLAQNRNMIFFLAEKDNKSSVIIAWKDRLFD